MNSNQRYQAKAEFFLCLARAFALPENKPAILAAFKEDLVHDLAELGTACGYPIGEAVANFAKAMASVADAQSLRVIYSRLFLTPGDKHPSLNTGAYIDGSVGGGSVTAMATCYQRCGLEKQETLHDLPDHVVVQLEFVAWLYAAEAEGDVSLPMRAEDFISTFIERDLPQFGLNAPSQTLRTLLQMLTGVHGNLLNQSTLANSLGLSVPTVKRYLSYFENSYFIRYLLPWHTNIGKRLVKTPKAYFRDSGVLHYLAGIANRSDMIGHQLAGASWEGYVVQQIIANLPQKVLPYFYRTKEGSELDLVLVKGNQPIMAMEIKMSSNPTLSKGTRLAHIDLGHPELYVITPHEGNYPLDDNIRVCGLEHILGFL